MTSHLTIEEQILHATERIAVAVEAIAAHYAAEDEANRRLGEAFRAANKTMSEAHKRHRERCQHRRTSDVTDWDDTVRLGGKARVHLCADCGSMLEVPA